MGSDSLNEDYFGYALSLEGRTAVVSAPYDDDRLGAAYIFGMSSYIRPTEVEVDVKPYSVDNAINTRSRGRFWVAILSTDDLDALRVDPTSVRLGAGGASPDKYRVWDSNYDGVADLLVRFRTQSVGIVCGDTTIELTGQTYDGVEIVGEDDVRTVGCTKPKPKKKGKKK
jgi:hypothetical protein